MTQKFGKGITYIRDICHYARENATDDDKKEILNTVEKVREYINNNINSN